MVNKKADTRVYLEWLADASCWACPIADQPWAALVGMVASVDGNLMPIRAENYHIEKSPQGESRIYWSGTDVERPGKVFALIAARPKPPGTFLKMPVPIVAPVAAAIAAGLISILIGMNNAEKKDDALAAQKIELSQCLSSLSSSTSEIASLEPYRSRAESLHNLFLTQPPDARITYLLGLSHAHRLEAIKRLSSNNNSLSQYLKSAEDAYIKSAIPDPRSSAAFTQGLAQGQIDSGYIFSLKSVTGLNEQSLGK